MTTALPEVESNEDGEGIVSDGPNFFTEYFLDLERRDPHAAEKFQRNIGRQRRGLPPLEERSLTTRLAATVRGMINRVLR